ncbi:aminodeoxychorismate synthase component I [Parachitinimonas caeni]|uniref:Aminodeoxychorismate synthase component I n=1 Tax=Parachitinimonas caeni TaxID=3031301 RepID=A0ABT7DXL2_9NEIS|nr:aminodeoxychorismate synthase component I [Parachitinimonas caeni]MDK2123818.1 aminodeoxychorismate synthase component I [Parachitinimonas caeni]
MHTESLTFVPDLLSLAAGSPANFPYLLQSSGETGWDILFALPASMEIFDRQSASRLTQTLENIRVQPDCKQQTLPFRGGWFVYLGYEWLEQLEPSVVARSEADFPLALLARIPAAILVNRADCTAHLIAETPELLALLKTKLNHQPFQPQPITLQALSEDTPERFLTGVSRCKQYIREGDVFQVNLSRGWDATLGSEISAFDLYGRLRQANPAPFSAYVDLGGQQIVSSSPERLVRIDTNGLAETRPIAGTHPRHADPLEDERQKQRLLASSKERAEHIMLIDLERNDLGRLATPGTVKVDALMDVTTYAFVHHIESTVSCQVRPGTNMAEVIRALFPGGTITGCPKVRTMQIIRELEDRPRHAYTGSLGYINHDGSMDLNILIRTFMQSGQQLYFRAGAGIVADSDPERELNETRAKARGLLRALGVQA